MTIKKRLGLILLLTFFLFSYTSSSVEDHTSNPASRDADSLGYLITGTLNQEAMDAGMEILKQGGTVIILFMMMAKKKKFGLK